MELRNEELEWVQPHIYKDSQNRFYWTDETGDLSQPVNTIQEAEAEMKRYARYLETGEVS